MPKLVTKNVPPVEDEAQVVKTENKKILPKKEEVKVTTLTSGPSVVLLGENQLTTLDSDTLDKILLIYKVDIKKEKAAKNIGRVTDAYKRELILEKQAAWMEKNDTTPVGLYELLGSEKDKFGSVSINMGMTINMSKFNSLKIDAGISLPINHTEADRDQAKANLLSCISLVQGFLEEEVPRAKSEMTGHYNFRD